MLKTLDLDLPTQCHDTFTLASILRELCSLSHSHDSIQYFPNGRENLTRHTVLVV